MRQYKIGKNAHPVYEDDDEIPESIKIISNWREAELGDWMRADDGNVIQALRVNQVMNQGRYPIKYIGTCTGTYLCRPTDKMDTERRENIYTFQLNRQTIQRKELLPVII